MSMENKEITITIGDKCMVNDGDAMRNATVVSIDFGKESYAVEIDGIGTKISNIPISVWNPKQ